MRDIALLPKPVKIFLGVCAAVLVIAVPIIGSHPEKPAATTPEPPKPVQEQHTAQAVNVQQKTKPTLPKEPELDNDRDSTADRKKFADVLAARGILDTLIVAVKPGVVESDVKIYVNNAWHYQPHSIRLQMGQNLWKMWAQIRSPNDPDKARISLRDLNDNSVGGSSWLGGSVVSVDD